MLQAKLAAAETSAREAHEQLALARAEGYRHHQAWSRTAKVCTSLQERLLEIEAALQKAEQQRVSESASAVDRLTQRHADFTASLAQAARSRDALAQQLNVAMAALEEARQGREADRSAAAEHLRRREAEFEKTLAASDAARVAVEQLVEDLRAAKERLTRREADLLEQLAHESDARTGLEQNLEHSERTRREADERHQLELAAAGSRFSDLQNAFEEARQQAAEIRESLERQLSETVAVLDRANQDRAADAAAAADRLAGREAELLEQLGHESDARANLEQNLENSERTRRATGERHQLELAAASARFVDLQNAFEEARQQAADQLAAREADLLEQLARESDARATLEQSLERSERTGRESEERHQRELGTASANLARELDSRASVERELGEVRTEFARTRARLLTAASTLRRRTSERRAQLVSQLADAREDHEQRLRAREEAIQLLAQERDTLRESLAVMGGQLQELSDTYNHERQEFERTHSRTESELQRVSAEHDQTLKSLDHLRTAFNTLEAVSSEHALERARLESVVADRDAHISAQESAHLAAEQAGKEALRQVEERLRQSIDARNGDVARLERELEALRHDLELARSDADALRGDAHQLPAVQRQLDASQQEVRRTKEDLRHGRRMESVGRLAQEVAATCDTLLRHMSQSGEQWLAAVSNDPVLRERAEQLVADVTQVTNLLQRLNAYGHEQVEALEPVDLSSVLGNLEPVLRRIAGNDIDLILPKTIPSYSVDVDRARVERVLVNVASYARERMPHGGRLKIDLASAEVDRDFLQRFPNVRPGRHVIATITEERSTSAPSAGHATAPPKSAKPAMDFSHLVRLLGDCGGHLWVTAEPTGNMTLKIHLPLRSSDRATGTEPSLARSTRGSSLTRWFRH